MQILLIDFRDGDHFEADTEVGRQRPRVHQAAFRRVRSGHADADDVLLAHGVRGDDGGQRGVDAAAQSEQHPPEAALANVVARAQFQSLVDRVALVGEVLAHIAGAGLGVHQDQVFAERGAAGDHPSIRANRETASVKNELVVPAHLVDVDHGRRVPSRGGGEDLAPQGTLAHVIRRRVDADQQLRPLRGKLLHRIAAV